MLPAQVLELGVGIEFGWRHLAACDSDHCRSLRTRRGQRAA